MSDEAPEVLRGRYEIVEVLGEGALGRTMLALDLERSRAKVAVKELLPSRMKRWKDLDLFHRECRALETLKHPSIPRYYEDFVIESEDEGPVRLFLVQEFISGQSLQDMLDEGKTFDEEQVRQIMVQVLDVLKYLHELNPPVIHRDLKPANLMLSGERVVLIDFGAVREAITFDGVGSTIVGTFGYMPPEQYAGKSVPATDLFALGATCVQLVSGRPPSELFTGLHHFKIPADLPVTLGFERILLRLTEPELSGRYQAAAEVIADLEFGFLMVPKESITAALPIPYEIIQAPRGVPGFHLRDAYHGQSHLGVILLAFVGFVLSTSTTVAAVAEQMSAFVVVGLLIAAFALLLGGLVVDRAMNEIQVYRRGIYTLGEVTGAFWSPSNDLRYSNLTYRYRVGNRFQYGCISTRDRAYAKLTIGDPLGIIYLADDQSEHVMYAVPSSWAKEQATGRSKRITSEPTV